MTAKSRGIIMTGESVRAILEGRKTQTRRLAQLTDKGHVIMQKNRGHMVTCEPMEGYGATWYDGCRKPMPAEELRTYSRYPVGTVLYVKEKWAPSVESPKIQFAFESDGKCYGIGGDGAGGWLHIFHGWLNNSKARGEQLGETIGRQLYQSWKSPLHMPMKLARLWIRITDVRLQRVQDISEEDARAEGMSDGGCTEGCIHCYGLAWNRINPKTPWSDNPWVWAFTFERIKKPTN